ncbi:zinc-ribbon domain-containing protein [Dehalococcoidia bacterium]|nr:zinc-ribbon domain-containing protein [Dehalococcoidia bacterium]
MAVKNIFCSSCGVEMAGDASFCSSCGTEIGSIDENVSSSIDTGQEKAPWFYDRNGERTGGLTESQMVDLIQSGEVG